MCQHSIECQCNSVQKKSKGATKGSKKRSSIQSGDGLKSSLSHLIHATLKCSEDIDKQHKNSGADIAALAMNFKQTADALGGRVQATLAFNKFKMFLNYEQ